MRQAFLLVTLMAFGLLSCDSEFVDQTKGGENTALLRAETYIAWTKIQECGAESGILGLVSLEHVAFTSLPLTDGLEILLVNSGQTAFFDILSAINCEEVLLALNFGQESAECSFDSPVCKDGLLSSCEPIGAKKHLITTDCSLFGLQCVNDTCQLPTCNGPRCEYDMLVTCDENGLEQHFDCAALGLACGRGADGLQCIGTGDHCSTNELDENALISKCDQESVVWCLGGRQARIECFDITDGRRNCSYDWFNKNKDVPPDEILTKYLTKTCAPIGAECEDGLMECEDTIIKICIDGIFQYLDCQAYQFQTCKTADGQAKCSGFGN